MVAGWQIIKWAVGIVTFVYIALQVVAMARLGEDGKKRSQVVLGVMVFAVVISNCVSLLIDNRELNRALTIAVGSVGVLAIVTLGKMLYGPAGRVKADS